MSVTGPGGGPLRLGVVGLGKPWSDRYRPAVLKRPERVKVAGVYDPVLAKAEAEASRLGARAFAGLREIMRSPDLDAVALLGSLWCGDAPLSFAAEAGVPCLVATPWAEWSPGRSGVVGHVANGVANFSFDLPGRFAPTSMRLMELFATRLGAPRLLIGRSTTGGEGASREAGLFDLIDRCRFLFRSEPVSVSLATASWAVTTASGPFDDARCLSLTFPGGALASVGLVDLDARPGVLGLAAGLGDRFELIAERGSAAIEDPDRLIWRDADGFHEEQLAADGTPTELILEQFCRAVEGGQSLIPGLEDARAIARVLDLSRA